MARKIKALDPKHPVGIAIAGCDPFLVTIVNPFWAPGVKGGPFWDSGIVTWQLHVKMDKHPRLKLQKFAEICSEIDILGMNLYGWELGRMLTHTILDASSVELWLVICEATTTGASKEHCRQLDGRNHGRLALLNSLKHPRGKRSDTRFF